MYIGLGVKAQKREHSNISKLWREEVYNKSESSVTLEILAKKSIICSHYKIC